MELEASLSWLALTMTPGIAARLSARLLREFGSAEAVFRASLTRLEACNLTGSGGPGDFQQAELLARGERSRRHSAHRLQDCELDGAGISAEPAADLRSTGDAVRARGRFHTEFAGAGNGGNAAAHDVRHADGGAHQPGPGFARPDDCQWIGPRHRRNFAQRRDGCGRAIGVLGTGIDVCYPKENKKLYEKVLERGAIISEFPTGWHPAPENFPVRNRIIAGMPIGVVIVEGKQYSGSLITARLAMEYGREVFGVPGNVTQDVSFAPNQFIKQGAKLVTSVEDVIEELPTPIRAALTQAEPMEAEQRNLLVNEGLTDTEKKLYALLSAEEAQPIDYLVETSGLNSSEVLATLFTLEMKGIIRQLPGKQFTKVLL